MSTDLLSYLPPYLRKSRLMQWIAQGINAEIDELGAYTDTARKQMLVKTATYMLDQYEDTFGLSGGDKLDMETRKARILSKMHGTSTVTPEILKSTVEAFISTQAAITERFSEYRVDINFALDGAERCDTAQILKAIADIIPAHLSYFVSCARRYSSNLYIGGATVRQSSRTQIPMPEPSTESAAAQALFAGGNTARQHKRYTVSSGVNTNQSLGRLTHAEMSKYTYGQLINIKD